jgi:hypothetical protein
MAGMKPAAYMAPGNFAAIGRKTRNAHDHFQKQFTVPLFTAAQVAIAACNIGLSDKTADRLRTELEK